MDEMSGKPESDGRVSGKKWMQFIFCLVLLLTLVLSAHPGVLGVDSALQLGLATSFGAAVKALFDRD